MRADKIVFLKVLLDIREITSGFYLLNTVSISYLIYKIMTACFNTDDVADILRNLSRVLIFDYNGNVLLEMENQFSHDSRHAFAKRYAGVLPYKIKGPIIETVKDKLRV